MTRLGASRRTTRSAVVALTFLAMLLAAAATGNTPATERELHHPRLTDLVAAANPWRPTDPGSESDTQPAPQGNLRSRFPAVGTGSVETFHRLSGLSLKARPKGLYIVRADGAQELIAAPRPVVPHLDADGGISYTDVYPGISTRYLTGPDHMRLEVFIENPAVDAHPRAGDMLQLRWQFELDNGGLVVRMPAPAGGIVLLDDERKPVVWLTEPVMPFERAVQAGAPPPRGSVSYAVDIVKGMLEVSMTVAWDSLIREGIAFPMIVHATTLAVMTER